MSNVVLPKQTMSSVLLRKQVFKNHQEAKPEQKRAKGWHVNSNTHRRTAPLDNNIDLYIMYESPTIDRFRPSDTIHLAFESNGSKTSLTLSPAAAKRLGQLVTDAVRRQKRIRADHLMNQVHGDV